MAHPNADQNLDACERNEAETCGCGSPRSDRPNPSPKTGDTRSINFSGFFRDFWKTPDLLTVCIGLALLVLTLFAERWGLREPWVRLIHCCCCRSRAGPFFAMGQ